jgi:hypothetical protein
MKKLLGRLGVVLAIATSLSMVATNGAYATSGGEGVVTGNGVISPGLTTVPTNQSVTFGGTLAGAFTVGVNATAGVVNCSFSGSSTIAETEANGQGTVSGSCSGGTGVPSAFSASGSLSYLRIGPVVVVDDINITVCVASNCEQNEDVHGVFLFEPTSANPTASYLLQGDVVADHP